MTPSTIAVKFSDVRLFARVAFPDYKGTRASVRIQPEAVYTAADLSWEEGCRTEVRAVRQNADSLELEAVALGTVEGQGYRGAIPRDVVLVEHSVACGHDLGLRFLVSPDSIYLPRLMAAPAVELSSEEVLMLSAHVQLKGGRHRTEAYERAGVSPSAVTVTIADLVARGLLRISAVGASTITIEGRNAVGALTADRRLLL